MHVEKLFWEQNCVVFSIHKEHDVTVSVILEFGKIPPKEPGTWSFWLYLCVHARACVCCYIEPDTNGNWCHLQPIRRYSACSMESRTDTMQAAAQAVWHVGKNSQMAQPVLSLGAAHGFQRWVPHNPDAAQSYSLLLCWQQSLLQQDEKIM